MLGSVRNLKEDRRHEIHIKLRKVNYDEKNRTLYTVDENEYTLHVRKRNWFIPVVTAGVILTNLDYTEYQSEKGVDDSGNTSFTVAEIGTPLSPIQVSGMLNIYPNINFNTSPFLQFGLSPARKFPIMYTGAGMTFNNRLNVSAGMAFQISQRLNNLKAGDIIANKEELNNNLSYVLSSDPKFYIGFSYFISK